MERKKPSKIEEILQINHGKCPGDELEQIKIVEDIKRKLLVEELKLEEIRRYSAIMRGMVEYACATKS